MPAALFQRLGSLKKSKKVTLSGGSGSVAAACPGGDSKRFAVQYLGCVPVSKVEGLDTVRPAVQVGSGCGLEGVGVVWLVIICPGACV